MRTQLIEKMTDGSKLQINVDFRVQDNTPIYTVSVYKCEKGKRTFVNPIDTDSYQFRSLSMAERAISVKKQTIEILGINLYNKALTLCHVDLKPTLL